MDTEAQAVLDFWFGAAGDADHDQVRKVWFQKNDDFDAGIRERFGGLVARSLAVGSSGWDATPHGVLARIIVLDQFTRNIFRGTPKAFDGDAQALAAARAMVAAGDDDRLAPTRRWFVYLPFEHAESLPMQDEAVRLLTRLLETAPQLNEALDFAQRHRDVIARFGRFPHRNAILGRESTVEELAFLQQPGSGF